MKAIEVYVNGEKVCTASVGAEGILRADVSWLGRSPDPGDFDASVTGLDSAAAEFLTWRLPRIGIGDEVAIRPVETDLVDPPAGRHPVDRSKFTPSPPG